MPRRHASLTAGHVVAVGDHYYVADGRWPVVAEVDRFGVLRRTWSLPFDQRARPVRGATTMIAAGTALILRTLGGRGLLIIDLESGSLTSRPNLRMTRHVVTDGVTVWVVSDGDEATTAEAGDGDGLRDHGLDHAQLPHHPLVRETEFVTLGPGGHFFGGFRDAAPVEPDPDDNDWLISWPSQVVPLDVESARPLGLDGYVHSVAAIAGHLVAVVRRPSDPFILHTIEYAPEVRSTSRRLPCSVMVLAPGGELYCLGRVANERVRVVADGRQVWVIDDDSVCEVELDARQLGQPVALPAEHVSFVGHGWIVQEGPNRSGIVDVTIRSTNEHTVSVQLTDRPRCAIGTDGELLVWSAPTSVIHRFHDGTHDHIDLGHDIGGCLPRPSPPPWLRVEEFEPEQVRDFRRELDAEWNDPKPSERLRRAGVTLVSVGIEGTYPDSQLVAVVETDATPRRRFGFRWFLYDLMGDFERMGGFAPRDMCEILERQPLPATAESAESQDIAWLDTADGW